AGNCGHLAQPRSRRRLAGPWSVRLPYLPPPGTAAATAALVASGTNRGQFLYFSATGSGARHDLTGWDPRPAATAAPETGFITGEQPQRAPGIACGSGCGSGAGGGRGGLGGGGPDFGEPAPGG